ncbi:putative disease resistance protein RGA3 [Pistacia vera]|uniref:putative disease resistance protein RGA3 n=1 Tax=Pistacia vera TaxID=55513 RepID=UPI001263E18C|nr:putative disease resistance protein RGA3 [Pistacia vera]XP_031249706.1 putative disease resistance protein RGA3 [Pistacia vera]XP_031249707.1 putative disease resistance protein RGA3 [Pistacia vera]XP_031249708.1 putative disease resistance protein RGA3 [Pistacia vera]XP_031249709.1 putative disease resistance protein RGA3 [Pistacia vera]XP_031249710.1 putative disease resistance protein RGA3 [Pistacia vera]XP_031249711.1 putative disease resistance protein RGA3 [Pistacia vera]XP_03124971
MDLVAQPVVSELFKGLFKILGSNEVRDFARNLVGGVDSELDELKKKLLTVEKLLRKAEDKQLTYGDVKEWLDNLQDWAYDAEDILDKFAYEALRRKLKTEHQPSCCKGLSCIPDCFSRAKFNVHMGSKIKDITGRLEQLLQERSDERGLLELSGGTSSNVAAPQRPEETSSVPPEKEVYGRDKDEAKLLDMVKSAQPSGANFRVIAIVGMGGIGKTTVARAVYNHEELEGFKFEEKAWVCVSVNFDVLTISKNILGSLKHSSSSNPNNLNEAQVELQKAVNGKKFLIVLDDVWEVDYRKWEQLISPFKAGAPGSTMIVTTRREDVAKTVRCSHIHHLKLLSKEACWDLFTEHALATGTAADADLITDSIRKRVLERCRGLPLAAKTLGGLLHSKPINTWERMLDSDVWNSFEENDVLPVLKLSYLYLPPHLKRCFTYCAIFPEDYEFEKEELVLLWMAEGIVQSFDTQRDVAGQYLNDLCSRSLFQKSSNDGSKYAMHDLVHDLAKSVSKKFSFSFEKSIIELPENVKRIRYFSYLSNRYDLEKNFKGLEKLENLKTFLPMYGGYYNYYISARVLFDLLPKLEKLRVLSLKRYRITHLPNSIGNLVHLRYLNFSHSRIKSLPESTSQLFNLQTLLLKDCSSLVKLPSNMRYLTNLYHLDISGQNLLEEMPSRMRELKNLRKLSNFIVGKESGSNLEDLKSLNFLQGELHISKLENVNNIRQIGGSILSNKNDLKVLSLEWGSEFDGSRVERVEKDVLEMLKPYSNLEKLTIRSYGGLEFPSWLSTSSSLSKLAVLKLENCKNCTNLPSENLLSSLKELVIERMPKLERINMRIPCNSLEVLRFRNLQTCQYWDTKGENENVENFPKLRELSVIECPELIIEMLDHLPSLKKLDIEKCAKWTVSFSSFPKLTKLEIDGCKEVVCTGSSTEFMSPESESLPNIVGSENWLSQGFSCVEKPLKWSHSLTSLKSLSIANCGISFLNNIFLPNLSRLEIRNCEALKSLPKRLKQNNIERLTILGCDSLLFIARNALPSSLKRLTISSCERVQHLEGISSTLLEELDISHCDSLLFIARNTLPSSLKRLSIGGCKKLQHLEGISSTLLEELDIGDCKSLTCLSSRALLPKTLRILYIYECRNLTTLLSTRWCVHESLETLYIEDCPKLKSLEEAFNNNPRLQDVRLVRLQNLESNRLFGLHNLTSLKELTLDGEEVEISKRLIRWGLHNLTSLKHLEIKGFEDPELILSEDQRMPTSLESLKISNFAPFRSVSDLGTLTSLTDLRIEDSPNLKSIPDLGSLVSLKSFCIGSCPKIKSIPDLGSHTSIEKFSIWSCPNLKSIACLGSLTSLQTLHISGCPKLKSLPSLPPSLVELRIWSCPSLKKQWRRGKGKYCSMITHIPTVRIDRKFIFNSKEEN